METKKVLVDNNRNEINNNTNEINKKPYEKSFEKDHPELAIVEKEKRKLDFESSLDNIVKEVESKNNENQEKEIEKPKLAEKQVDNESKPQADNVEELDSDTTKPDKADKENSQIIAADDIDIIKKYAEQNSISEEQAAEEVESNKAILKKYKDDPIELAKAYRSLQSTYDKQKLSDIQSQQARMVNEIIIDPRAFVAKAELENSSKWIEEYRKTYPAKSELMTDAAIVEECRQIALNQVNGQISEYQVRLKSDANTRRQELIKSIPESDRSFSTEIGQVLAKFPDSQIVSQDFAFKDLVRWARGSETSIKKLVKEAEERGYKMAQEGKILGEKFIAKTPSITKPKPRDGTSSVVQLSEYEKRQAREKFSSAYDNDEDRYTAYIDVYKRRKK